MVGGTDVVAGGHKLPSSNGMAFSNTVTYIKQKHDHHLMTDRYPSVDNQPEWNSSAAITSAAPAADRSWIAAMGSRRVPLIRYRRNQAVLSRHASYGKATEAKVRAGLH